jgi:hypothetical protein
LQGTLSFAKTKETLEKFPAKEIKERKKVTQNKGLSMNLKDLQSL